MAFSFRLNAGGEPGDGELPSNLIIVNLAIMLVCELVVTDGLIGHLARRFKKRYISFNKSCC